MEENKREGLKADINPEFKIYHNITTQFNMRDFHFHDSYEIYYAMSDRVKYFVEDNVYNVEKGDIFIFNSLEIHKTIVPSGIKYERYIILFNPGYMEEMSTANTDLMNCFLNRKSGCFNRIRLDSGQSQLFIKLVKKAEKYMNSNLYGFDVYRKIYLAEILLTVNSFYNQRLAEYSSDTYSERDEYKRIRPVILYIKENIGNNLNLSMLSKESFISRYHLGYLFKKSTGFTINKYIINYRIIEAKRLLYEGYPVSAVCEMVGYENVSHFIRTFRNYTGTTPGKYIKNRQ